MIINGLIDDGTKLTLSYNVLDGSRGTKPNPYRLIDIFDTCVANGWDYIEKINNSYLLKYQLDTNFGINFKIDNENVELKNNSGELQNWNWYGNFILTNCKIFMISLILTDRIRFRFNTNDENIYNNVVFSGQDTIAQMGGKYIIFNMQWNKIDNSYICYFNSDVTIDNFLAINGNWGFIPQNNFTLATILKSEKCKRGVLAGYGSFDLYNYSAKNNTLCDIGIVLNGQNRFCNFIDPDIDINKIILYGDNNTGQMGINRNGYVNLKSTFKLLFDDADYIIEDNYGNKYTDNTSDVNELELIYWRYEGDNFEYEIKNAYEPFKISISKTGYETTTIEDVYITSGQPTIIRATLKEQNKIRQTIDGDIFLATKPEQGSASKLLKI